MVEAPSWPKTALTTQSVNQVGDLDDKDDASAIDESRDSWSVEDPSEGVNDGSDEEDDKEYTFFNSISR